MELKTPAGPVSLPDSLKTYDNVRQLTRRFEDEYNRPCELTVSVRWDDRSKNGHNTLSLTADVKEYWDGAWRSTRGGCLHDLIGQVFPELAYALPYHLVSSDGPLHYFANTVFHAGDKDCWGGAKGVQRRSNRSGKLLWQLTASPFTISHSDTEPEAVKNHRFVPVLGEGKPRDLEAARRSACWPDAEDKVLCGSAEELQKVLAQRLPSLMASFKSVIERLGFVY